MGPRSRKSRIHRSRSPMAHGRDHPQGRQAPSGLSTPRCRRRCWHVGKRVQRGSRAASDAHGAQCDGGGRMSEDRRTPFCFVCASYHGLEATCWLKQIRAIGPFSTHHVLELAARLIEEHAATLNLKSEKCGHCSRETFEAPKDRQQHIELMAMVQKLRGLASLYRSKNGTKTG